MSTNPSRFDNLARMGSPEFGGVMTPMDRTPIVETAEISRVDSTLFVVDAITKGTGRTARNIDVGGSAVHRFGGTMTSMPEVGDKCLIVWPSDDVIPRILGYLPYVSRTDGARAGRRAMRPGDKLISTSSGSYLHMHAGGLVEVAANPLTRRMYIPVLNSIKDFFENYEMSTPAGRFRWEHRRDSMAETGPECEWRWEIRSHGGAEPTIFLRRGSVFEVQDMPSETRSHDEVTDEATGDTMYRLSIDADGNVFMFSQGDHRETSEGERVIAARDGVVISGSAIRSTTSPTPSPGRGRLKVSVSGGTEIGSATEPAVLGQTQLSLLTQYTTALTSILTSLLTALSTMSKGATDPGVKALDPGLVPIFAANLQIQSIAQQFPTFLALDTKLS